eukprot:1326002-Amorphochlora_amoeboformis.AAC.2
MDWLMSLCVTDPERFLMAYRRSRPPGSGRRVIVSRGRVYAPSQFVLGCVVGFILSFVVMVAVLTYFLPAIAKGTMPPMAPTSANTAIPGISGEAKVRMKGERWGGETRARGGGKVDEELD